MERRQFAPAEGDPNGGSARVGTQGEQNLRTPVGVGGGMLDVPSGEKATVPTT